ncbi:Gamma-glutamylputrescine oxidoreductase [Roseivivax jejudonensis]|uniref:Gamma-glutamylputrescine oxidoreductase n=1 Tax=Roseivivax jejudonensis TaxID=1529041 RepID=A0A1X6YHC2_9RHOB|nr:FAD-binding oxidoreductase [Roseivivax jejudonensis]SLN21438.1 Gamma-glutamylputrescine oxidoreductase [Roseivivax jejudonensis]
MERLYEAAAYAPPAACFWGRSTAPDWPALDADATTEVAVIGGGFTGLSAALHLAEAGMGVTVLDAAAPGFGASRRNGGFCCLGGAKASDRSLERRFGPGGARDWHAAERAAVETVADLLDRHGIAADTHSAGETQLAHTPRAMRRLRRAATGIEAAYGVTPEVIGQDGLRQAGLGGPFHGAMTIPIGFALDPARYHDGLASAAAAAGAVMHAHSAVTGIRPDGARWRLETGRGPALTADRVIVATNGYGSEDVPGWMRGRTLPVLSNVIVTRPLTEAERAAQGWTSRQMAYDTRELLHYFRLLPDDRFLFGMRGGLSARPGETRATDARIRRHFAALFPAWADVEITHGWSGLACLTSTLTPYVGPVPDMPGVLAGFGYHGNGVAMGSHAGRILADLALDRPTEAAYPAAMRRVPSRIPLGRYRRTLLRPAYLVAEALDL